MTKSHIGFITRAIAFLGSGLLFVVVHVLFTGFRRDAGPSHTELAARHGV